MNDLDGNKAWRHGWTLTTYEPMPGAPIWFVVREMVRIANSRKERVVAKFNGTPLVALPGANPAVIEDDYRRMRRA